MSWSVRRVAALRSLQRRRREAPSAATGCWASFVGLLFPEFANPFEAGDSFADLHNLLRIELEHHVAEFQHPPLSRIARYHGHDIRVGDLNLAPSKCAYRQAIPSEKLDGNKRDISNCRLHAFHTVADQEYGEEVRVVLVEPGQALDGSEIGHVELRVGPVRLDVDDVIQAIWIFEREVGHSAASEVRGVLATVLAKDLLEGCPHDVLDGIARCPGALRGVL